MKNRRKISFIYSISHFEIIAFYVSIIALAIVLALINPHPSFAAGKLLSPQPQGGGECANVNVPEYLSCASRDMPYPECAKFLKCYLTCNPIGGSLSNEEILACIEANDGQADVPPNPEPYIDPDPYIDLNPDPIPEPNPDPGPIGIDQETLRILQSILSAPGLPITGAVAGGLVAWVISMLGGRRTVPPMLPRPPRGGFRPGQMGPDGRVWSPQGWVSKSTYDYQQKWLQKGWQLNPQTNKLEVRPGAVNDSGQVWYKLPHAMDEGDSHYWVDKAKVQECERNLAEGKVWDRNIGWQAPKDLADYNAQKDKISSPEARQRDHERLMQQEVAPNPQLQKLANDIKQMEDKFNQWRSDSIKGDMESEQRKSQRQSDRADTMDRWSKRAGVVETGADVFISVAATLTGPVGKSIEKGYNTVKRTALAVDTAIDKGSVTAGVVDYGKRYVTDKAIDKVSSVLSVDTLSPVPGKVFKKLVSGTGKPGVKAFSKPLLKGVKGIGAVVDIGKGELLGDGYDELGEYLDKVIKIEPGGWMPK